MPSTVKAKRQVPRSAATKGGLVAAVGPVLGGVVGAVVRRRTRRKPFAIGKRSLGVMDSSMRNLKRGKASAPIDLDKYADRE